MDLGSAFGGVKAGVISGIAYFTVLAVFDVALLFILKDQAIAAILAGPSSAACPVAYDCLIAVMQISVPFFAVIGFFVSLIFAAIFGRYFESIPGKTPRVKGVSLGLILLISLVFLDLVGLSFSQEAAVASDGFELVASIGYGLLLGILYQRYTRAVEFVGEGAGVQMLVDGKDFTGKTRTFAAKSSHEVKAELSDKATFRAWSVSGGVSVEDPRSFETTMEVDGDGLLKVQTGKK